MVVAALVSHYINDRLAFLTEVRRMLVPEGVLGIITHHPAADWHRLGGSYFAVEAMTETWSKGWEITAWSMLLLQLATEFAQAGFVNERLVEPLPRPEMAARHPEDIRRHTQD